MRLENTFLFVDGIGERTERRIWDAGITHWEDFTPESVAGIGPSRSRTIERTLGAAREALDDGATEFFGARLPTTETWRMYENFADEVCYLDIETTGLSVGHDRTTTVSIYQDGLAETFVRGRDLHADRLERRLEDPPLLVTYNGARFDIPFLQQEFDIAIPTPHLDLLGPCRRLGLTGGLKRVERTLGIDRPIDDVDGRMAVQLWREYEAGDETALERLVRYNRIDAKNLEPVAARITARLDAEIFRGETGNSALEPDG